MFWHILDIFFVIFHTALALFNLFGWILNIPDYTVQLIPE